MDENRALRIVIPFVLAFCPNLSALAQTKSAVLQRLLEIYSPTQKQSVIEARLKQSGDAFGQWRSFPPLYYSVLGDVLQDLSGNPELVKKFKGREGLCAGDAHFENFGVLALNPPRFTLNDLDDVSTGSLNADAMRLYLGFKLLQPGLTSQEFLAAYSKGLAGETPAVLPASVQELQKKSAKKGTELSKKNRALFDADCKDDSGEFAKVSDAELAKIQDFMNRGQPSCFVQPVLSKSESDTAKTLSAIAGQGGAQGVNRSPAGAPTVLRACRRTKEFGGSAGADRYLVFYGSDSDPHAFELKQLMPPATKYQVTPNDKRSQQFSQAVQTVLGDGAKTEYYPVLLGEELFQRRPAWGGNQGVKLEDLKGASEAEIKSVMLLEAQTLGQLHRKSNSTPLNLSPAEWDQLAQSVQGKWKSLFE